MADLVVEKASDKEIDVIKTVVTQKDRYSRHGVLLKIAELTAELSFYESVLAEMDKLGIVDETVIEKP